MDARVVEIARGYARTCHNEQVELLERLARIPAPSHDESRRASFVSGWLRGQGAEDVSVDSAGNVILRVKGGRGDGCSVFSAHTDVVFPDTGELPLWRDGGRMYAPGVGDDTACLVSLMLAARWFVRNAPSLDRDLLVVANSCEEGLGNLEGTRRLLSDHGEEVVDFVSFDTYLPDVVTEAVGSLRYRLRCHAAGGHSWADFGERNAIIDLCDLISDIQRLDLPTTPKTTRNVGRIEGGTTVNSIAQEASALLEFRSCDQARLDEMDIALSACVESARRRGADVSAEPIGMRPAGGAVDADAQSALVRLATDALRSICQLEPRLTQASTDANIPLSLGVPAITVGAVTGGGAHTRDEWVDEDSLETGLALVLGIMASHVVE